MTDTIIFTDGAARGNPGPGGWGAILATEEMVTELGGGEEHTTNNRMELFAAISALEKTGFSEHDCHLHRLGLCALRRDALDFRLAKK